MDLSAYRIIQEALTNVVRHAGTGAVCVVSLAYTDAELIIRVTDDGGLPGLAPPGVATAGTGHGIIGMRERVHLCGGTFAIGPVPEGGFRVTAVLPLPIGTVTDSVPGPGSTAHTAIRAPGARIEETAAAPAAQDLFGLPFASHGGRG
jgi:signal transduction histidine kinase